MIEVAHTPLARMRGLLGRKGLPPGQALLLKPCNAIHTLGMNFPIDVRFYNKEGHLVREALHLRPGRWIVWGGWKAHCALECQAGDPSFQALTQLTQETLS